MSDDQEKVHNPHDKGYRHFLDSKKAFIQLIRSFIKYDWVEQVDEANLELVNKKFVLQDFKDKEAGQCG